jgi:elongation factor P
MASPTDLRKGRVILYQGAPHLVLEVLHRTQGRQAGFMQVTLRHLVTGSSTTTKIRTTDSVDFCHTETRKLEYSYADNEGFHFLHPETFEDTVLSRNLLEEQKKFLIENTIYDVLFVDERAVQLQLPAAVTMKVVESPEGIRGDTASSVQKPAVTETGLTVQVPLFIQAGETIRVSTEDGKYLSRA